MITAAFAEHIKLFVVATVEEAAAEFYTVQE